LDVGATPRRSTSSLGATVTSAEVAYLVELELRNFGHSVPAQGTTVGIPWSADKVAAGVSNLHASLVTPYLQEFALGDSFEEATSPILKLVKYWIVAKTPHYCEYFDPALREFGLANLPSGSDTPRTIGVRGDLVTTFLSM
jgi:hypothetical protein